MKYQEDGELGELIKAQAIRYAAPQGLRERISADIRKTVQEEKIEFPISGK